MSMKPRKARPNAGLTIERNARKTTKRLECILGKHLDWAFVHIQLLSKKRKKALVATREKTQSIRWQQSTSHLWKTTVTHNRLKTGLPSLQMAIQPMKF